MARGRVVEDGPAETVMGSPTHPYTQLLLQSIPSPDPDERWHGLPPSNQTPPAGRADSRDRCLFAERCPYTMDRCWQQRPPRYTVNRQHAACYLHRPEAAVPAVTVMQEPVTAAD